MALRLVSSKTLASTKARLQRFPTILATRSYRGESGDMKPRSQIQHDDSVVQREEALLAVAMPKATSIYELHTRLPTIEGIPEASLPYDMVVNSEASKGELELQVRKKRLVYRSKQRGWLEVDVLLGTWASLFVEKLTLEELDEFENFVNLETIDIYNIITLKTDIPESLKAENGDGIIERIQEWARSSPLGKGDPEKYGNAKKEHNLI